MNILLLGGSGFIGSRLARRLRETGHQVRTPSRRELDLLNPIRRHAAAGRLRCRR